MEKTNKLYKIDTKFKKGYNTKYMTTYAYGTWERVQEKQSEAIEKMIADYGVMPYLGIYIKSKVTLIKDIAVILSRGSE